MKKTKFSIYLIISIILTLGVSLSLQSLLAVWTPPTAAPPGVNVFEPINVSGTSQTKIGNLTLSNSLDVAGDFSSDNNTLKVNATTNTVSIDKLDVTGGITSSNRRLYLGLPYLYSDNFSTLFFTSNSDTITQMTFRDKQNTTYGRIYGSGNGVNFGLLDGDGSWSYLAVKDNYTAFRINNSEKMRINFNGNIGINESSPTAKLTIDMGVPTAEGLKISRTGNTAFSYLNIEDENNNPIFKVHESGSVGIGDSSPDGGLKLDVEGKVGATEYCDENGGNCTVATDLGGGSSIPTCIGNGEFLQYDGSQWKCLVTLAPSKRYHTADDCIAIGGQVVMDNAVSDFYFLNIFNEPVCKTPSNCPTGWHALASWWPTQTTLCY